MKLSCSLTFSILAAAFALTPTLAASSANSLLSQTDTMRNGSASTTAIVLGVGSPTIDAERSGTSIGIVAGGTLYVVDAGPGVERRIMEASPKLKALQAQRLGPVFISHLHADHTLGLPALLVYHNINSNGLLVSRGEDVTVYGPGPARGAEGITGVIDHLTAAFFSPIVASGIRAEELSRLGGPKVHAIELKPGVVYQDSNLTVTAFEVAHKTPIAFGFRIQTVDRLIVISGDTRPVDAVVNACNGCDLLFHELYSLD